MPRLYTKTDPNRLIVQGGLVKIVSAAFNDAGFSAAFTKAYAFTHGAPVKSDDDVALAKRALGSPNVSVRPTWSSRSTSIEDALDVIVEIDDPTDPDLEKLTVSIKYARPRSGFWVLGSILIVECRGGAAAWIKLLGIFQAYPPTFP